ncbi:MAG: hypothetical protein IPI91_16425 [Flavobacteriales bacterium]|nr:hypothetical protein [Flavobacteriales bacterium]
MIERIGLPGDRCGSLAWRFATGVFARTKHGYSVVPAYTTLGLGVLMDGDRCSVQYRSSGWQARYDLAIGGPNELMVMKDAPCISFARTGMWLVRGEFI